MHLADALEQQFGRSLLWHDAAASLPHGFEEIFFQVLIRQHDDAGRELSLLNRGKIFWLLAELAGHPKRQMSGWDFSNLIDSARCRVGTPDNCHIRLSAQQICNPVAEQVLVIYDKNT